MIPTAVIVNDNNPQLNEITKHLQSMLRVVKRTSLDGEKLYSTSSPFFEGVLYFDDHGVRQVIRQDKYDDVVKSIEDKLQLVSSFGQEQLKKYLAAYQEQLEKDLIMQSTTNDNKR